MFRRGSPFIASLGFESSLYLELIALVHAACQDELAQAVEGVGRAIEGHKVGISEDAGDSRRLVGHAVLRRTSLEAVRLAAHRLLLLPEAAGVEGTHVVEPHGQRGHLAGLVPGHLAQVVDAAGSGAPHLVVGQHQEAVAVVAALLLSSLGTGKYGESQGY